MAPTAGAGGGRLPGRVRWLAGSPLDSDVLGYLRARHLALAVMFAAGSTLALASLAVPHGHGVDTSAEAVAAGLGYPAAGVLLVVGRRLPGWAAPALLAFGSALVSVGVYFGHHSGTAVAAAFFYVWVGLYAAAFLRRSVAVGQALLALAGYAAVLVVTRPAAAAAQMLLIAGTTVVTGVVVAMLRAELVAVAVTDPLTRLPNRRALSAVLVRDLARATRTGSPLTLVLLDLDGLKAVNDSHGHGAGDDLLRRAAAGWLSTLRRSDALARYGGDEFAMVLPDTGPADAVTAVQRLRAAVPGVAFSAGSATLRAGESAAELLARADAELYRAKSATPAAPGRTAAVRG